MLQRLYNNVTPAGQCSLYHDLTRGTSTARRVRPDLILNGRGAHKSAMPFPVLSVYKGTSSKIGMTASGSAHSSSCSSAGRSSNVLKDVCTSKS